MRAWCSVALALAAFLQPAAPPAPAAPAGDTLVRVDAFVADARGRTIDNLKASDFDLREDGAPRTIDAVRFVRADGRAGMADTASIASDADEQREASRPGVRLFAIFLDEYHITPGAPADRAREAVERFIANDVGPQDLLVVMKPLDSLFSIHLTYDRAAARATLEAFEGRKGDYTLKNAYEREYMASTPAAMEQMRMQVTMSALNSLAVHLGWASHDARKSLIVVSEGFGAAMRRRRGSSLPTLEQVVRSANRANVSVYPVDPRATSEEPDGEEDALLAAATQTDGRSTPGGGDLDAGLRQVAVDASAYYLISYRSPGRTDNKFHQIRLAVKRRGAVVRTRQGYWALSPDDLMRADVIAKMNAPKRVVPLEPAPHSSPLIRPWFGLARGDNGKTRVTFVWEPAARVPGERVRHLAARLTLTALGPDGKPVFEGPVIPAGPGTFDTGEGVPARAVFDVAPGRVRIRMAIEDASLQQIDSDVRSIFVRDLHDERDPVVLGTPEVLRARTALEQRSLEADPDAPPVASREFSRTERLVIRVPAYAPDGAPTLSATLMSRMGQAMRTLTVTAPSAPGGNSEIHVPLAGLAAGEYLIQLTASSPAGQAKDQIGFRVTS
jgi:VWFA-related protein